MFNYNILILLVQNKQGKDEALLQLHYQIVVTELNHYK
jgi:hypothetical protein